MLAQMVNEARGLGFVVYLSMAYGDPWTSGLTAQFVQRLRQLPGLAGIVLADTYGVASAQTLEVVARAGGLAKPLGLHLHSRPEHTHKVRVALEFGVAWLEGALGGIGGCPFAGDALVGNLATEQVLPYLAQRGQVTKVDLNRLPDLSNRALVLRTKYA